MKIDNNFIQLISHKNTLNKEQFKILGLDYPSDENWKNQALDKEVSKNDMNLLMLLKGDLSLKAQEQIIKNYHMVLEFNNIKPKSVYEIPKEQKGRVIVKETIDNGSVGRKLTDKEFVELYPKQCNIFKEIFKEEYKALTKK